MWEEEDGEPPLREITVVGEGDDGFPSSREQRPYGVGLAPLVVGRGGDVVPAVRREPTR